MRTFHKGRLHLYSLWIQREIFQKKDYLQGKRLGKMKEYFQETDENKVMGNEIEITVWDFMSPNFSIEPAAHTRKKIGIY